MEQYGERRGKVRPHDAVTCSGGLGSLVAVADEWEAIKAAKWPADTRFRYPAEFVPSPDSARRAESGFRGGSQRRGPPVGRR